MMMMMITTMINIKTQKLQPNLLEAETYGDSR